MAKRLQILHPRDWFAGLTTAQRTRLLFASVLVIGVAGGAVLFGQRTPAPAPAVLEAGMVPPSTNEPLLAETAFNAQARGDIAWADELIAHMKTDTLRGHLMAERYLSAHYTASKQEVLAWLARYSDHPQAPALRSLAARKGASANELAAFPASTKRLKGDGYAEHLGRTAMPQGWYTALSHYKEARYNSARTGFLAVASDVDRSDWQRSAGYYWAARADDKLGRASDARTMRDKAAAFSTTFYGQLASMEQRGTTPVMAAAPRVPRDLRNHPAVIRASALAQANQRALAENELRTLAAEMEKAERGALLTLAAEMGLPNLQLRLSTLSSLSAEEKLFGNYPMPPWIMQAQSTIDPALLLAIARQESAFRHDAGSNAGAQGMMQMLPSTARIVEGNLSRMGVQLASANDALPLSKQLSDPAVSIRLGAEYVAMLGREPAIKGNMVKLLAAYNAGPGAVQSWQGAARTITDPLLYIESIPYPETRNYVMQVLAHQWVYQTLMGNEPASLEALADGKWPTLG